MIERETKDYFQGKSPVYSRRQGEKNCEKTVSSSGVGCGSGGDLDGKRLCGVAAGGGGGEVGGEVAACRGLAGDEAGGGVEGEAGRQAGGADGGEGSQGTAAV